MAVIIIDNFSNSNSHGFDVKDSLEEFYSNNIFIINTYKDMLTWDETYNILNQVLTDIKLGKYKNITAINMSYGGGETNTPKYWLLKDEKWYNLWKEFFDLGIELFFPAGNESNDYPNYNGVSVLSSSPFVHSVTALHGSYDKIKDDLDKWIPHYAEYCYEITTEGSSGYSPEMSIGTSFSSPKLAGIYAHMIEEKHFTPIEVRTAYKMTAEPIEAYNHEYLWFLDSEEMLSLSNPIEVKDNPKTEVWALYNLVCGRNPDPEGFSFWATLFESIENDEIKEDNLIQSFIDSAVANHDVSKDDVPVFDKIQSFYWFFFGREPDRGGISYWIDQVMHSHDWQDVFEQIWSAGQGHEPDLDHEQFIDDILDLSQDIIIFGVNEKELDGVDFFTNNV